MSYSYILNESHYHFEKMFKNKEKNIKVCIQINKENGSWLFYYDYLGKLTKCEVLDSGSFTSRDTSGFLNEEISAYFFSLLLDIKKTKNVNLKLLTQTQVHPIVSLFWSK